VHELKLKIDQRQLSVDIFTITRSQYVVVDGTPAHARWNYTPGALAGSGAHGATQVQYLCALQQRQRNNSSSFQLPRRR